MMIQVLTIAEKTVAATSLPFLKGAISTVLAIVECAQGYKSNNEQLNQFALRCGALMKKLLERIESGPDLSDGLKPLVAELLQTFEEWEKISKTLSSAGKAKLFFCSGGEPRQN